MPNMTSGTALHTEDTDLVAELKKDLEDEAGDHDKYLKLAMAADEKYPWRGYGAILRDIAKEEGIHRKHIQMILEDMHVGQEE